MKAALAIFTGCALVASAAVHHHRATTSGPGGTSDQAFVNLAAQTDMAEANLGQLAQEHAASQGVKDYAQMLVTDHTADYTKISDVATKAGLTVPKGLDAQHVKMGAPLKKLNGAAFDRQYAHMMVSGHEGAIAAYNKESRDGKNADLKAYAQASIPTLEKHKSAAQDLVKSKK
jgi:putative membrane protein